MMNQLYLYFHARVDHENDEQEEEKLLHKKGERSFYYDFQFMLMRM